VLTSGHAAPAAADEVGVLRRRAVGYAVSATG
jgi:hypothetical protein